VTLFRGVFDGGSDWTLHELTGLNLAFFDGIAKIEERFENEILYRLRWMKFLNDAYRALL
jgi:hypothetical protein